MLCHAFLGPTPPLIDEHRYACQDVPHPSLSSPPPFSPHLSLDNIRHILLSRLRAGFGSSRCLLMFLGYAYGVVGHCLHTRPASSRCLQVALLDGWSFPASACFFCLFPAPSAAWFLVYLEEQPGGCPTCWSNTQTSGACTKLYKQSYGRVWQLLWQICRGSPQASSALKRPLDYSEVGWDDWTAINMQACTRKSASWWSLRFGLEQSRS